MHSCAKVFLTLLVSTLFLCGTESRAKADELQLLLVNVNQKGSLASLIITQSVLAIDLPLPGYNPSVFGLYSGQRPSSRRIGENSIGLRRLSDNLTTGFATFSTTLGHVRDQMLPEVGSDLYAGTTLLVTTEHSLIGRVARFGFSALTLNLPPDRSPLSDSAYRSSLYSGVKATVLAVPEKATMLLLGLGLALAGTIVRRRLKVRQTSSVCRSPILGSPSGVQFLPASLTKSSSWI